MKHANIREEELKNKVVRDYAVARTFAMIADKRDWEVARTQFSLAAQGKIVYAWRNENFSP